MWSSDDACDQPIGSAHAVTRSRLFAVLLLPALLLAGVARSQESSATALNEEYAFWTAANGSGNPAEIQAYLDAYPNGHFRALAQTALAQRAGAALNPDAQSAAAPEAGGRGRLHPSMPVVELVDGVPLDLDAESLQASSNLRVIVVPATAPDAIDDTQRFVEEATPVRPQRLHLTVPAGPPGQDEVRLYHIPPFASSYAIAARAPVTVRPGVAGAVLLRDLSLEAARTGPARFEALHRDRPILVQAAFLALSPRTEWNMRWFGDQTVESSEQTVVVKLGLPNAAPDAFGSVGDAVCLLSAANQSLLERLTTLRGGDPVLVSAIPSIWNSDSAADAIVLNRCSLRG